MVKYMDKTLKVIKALADENRFKIIRLLLQKNFCVGALAKRLGISKSAVSQHLKILRDADLVMGEKKGYYVHYRVKLKNLKKTGEYLLELKENQKRDLKNYHKYSE